MLVKNYMEDLVWQSLEGILVSHPEVCQCDHCRHDIAAYALNTLPSRYIVTRKGETYTRINMLELQCSTDIITAITKAIEKVGSQPRHSEISEEDL